MAALNKACFTAARLSARMQLSTCIRQQTVLSRFSAAPASARIPVATTTRRLFSQTPRRSYQKYNPRDPHDPYERLRDAKPLFTDRGFNGFIRSPSTHTVVAVAFIGAVSFYFYNVQTVPISGRKRFNCFTEESVEAVSEQQVKRIEYEVERQGGRFLNDWDPRTRLVKRVMRRLIPVSGMEDSDWEVRVIDDPRMIGTTIPLGS